MARGPDIPGQPMTIEGLERFRHSIGLLAPSILEIEYRCALEKVRLRPLLPLRRMRELVPRWRQLWQTSTWQA
jgi:hypothetical protein